MKKLITLITLSLMAFTMTAGELTVADGSAENAKLPVNGYYCDVAANRTQFVYTAYDLAAIAGNDILSLTFHAKNASMSWGAAEFVVAVAEVEESTLSGFLAPDFTEVYAGSLSIESSELVIAFADKFAYSGKNLLVDISQTKACSYYDAQEPTFYGIETEGAGYGSKVGSYGTASVVNFLPKTTFTFSGEAVAVCPRPSKLTGVATPDGAVLTWQGEEGTQCQYCIVPEGQPAAGWILLSVGEFAYTATGLAAGTAYDFHVRTYCSETEQSSAVKLTFTPVCSAPAEIRMAGLIHNAVTLSWDAVAGISKYQYVCARKDAAVNWTGVEAEAVTSVKLDTLQTSTAYDFYVRSYFNEATQSEAVKLSFTTNCVAAAMPFSENFDAEELAEGSVAEMPLCWESENYNEGGNSWAIGAWYDECSSKPNAARYNGRSSAAAPADLKTPAVELTEHALLKFAYRNQVTAEVLVFDGTEETLLFNVPADNWKTETIDLGDYTGRIVNIIFRAHANNKSNYFYVDDVQIVAKPCSQPAKLRALASSDGALVTWIAGDEESVWNLRYSVKDADAWTEVNNLEEPSYSISGLEQGTEYEVQVQAACSAGKHSEWTASVTFIPQCPQPVNLKVAEVTDNSAVVSWESGESKFILRYKADEDDEWTEIRDIEALAFKLTELEGSTLYKVQVQAACEGELSTVRSFTTKCAPLKSAVPFSEDFENVAEGSLPDCWEVRANPITDNDNIAAVEATTAAKGATEEQTGKCIRFAGSSEQILVLPAFDDDLSNQALLLYYKAYSASLELGYLKDLYGDFRLLEAVNGQNNEYRYNLISLPKAAKYLAVRYTATSDYASAYVDDVRIQVAEDQTAAETVAAVRKVSKRIVNGHLLIELDNATYNAQGAVVR